LIRQTTNRPISTGNPIANIIVIIVGAVVIGAFIVLGVVAAVAISGILVVMATILGIRLWWLDRKSGKKGRNKSAQRQAGPGDSAVIEGEFQVVSPDEDENRAG
jgi:Flp pilus assembly protein TadB